MTMSESFPLKWLPKQFTQDYLSNYMIDGHARVKVFLPKHNDYLDVLMKIEGWAVGHHKGLDYSRACLLHGGGHNMGIPLHLV